MTVIGQTAVTYGYDGAHRLTSITQGTATASLTYDAANRRSTLTYPNGVVATYTYDSVNRLVDICFTLGQTTVGELTYAYDSAGNRTTVGGSWARSGLPPALTSATYDAANRIVTWGGASSTYDLNGNLTSDGTNSYTWNARNQLAAMSGSVSASFNYDALGRRRAKTVSSANFLYDGLSLVQELSGGTPTANLLGGPGIDEILVRTGASGASTLLTDALGSTLALTDASGTVQTSYSYEPFGQTTVTGAATTSSMTFTGREADGTGLNYYRARYYDPRLKRFLKEDPVGFGGGSVDLYVYVNNRPTMLTDPTGKNPFLILPLAGCLGGGIGAGAMSGWSARKMMIGCAAGALIGLGGAAAFAAEAAEAAAAAEGAAEAAAEAAAAAEGESATAEAAGMAETEAGAADEVPAYSRQAYGRPSAAQRAQTLEQSPTCSYCGESPSSQVDHVNSLKGDWQSGGYQDDYATRTARMNDPSNLTGSCASCNASKGASPIGQGPGQWWPSGWPSGVWWPRFF
jgi:RHS repeat-associated protein